MWLRYQDAALLFPELSCHIRKYIKWPRSLKIIIGSVKQKKMRKIVIIFLFISLIMCFWCSKELSYRDGSFEYPQHMFWLRNKKIFFSYTFFLILGPEL